MKPSTTMKPRLFGAILLAAVSVHAELLKPIDIHERADVNDKTVNLPTVNFDSISQPTRPQPVAPLTGRVHGIAQTVETKRVDTHTVSFDTVPDKMLSPQQNFSPKRASVAGNVELPPPVSTSPAEIEKRVIRPLTPAGAEELKKQLNEPH